MTSKTLDSSSPLPSCGTREMVDSSNGPMAGRGLEKPGEKTKNTLLQGKEALSQQKRVPSLSYTVLATGPVGIR